MYIIQVQRYTMDPTMIWVLAVAQVPLPGHRCGFVGLNLGRVFSINDSGKDTDTKSRAS
jgi:hypothetical protein